MPRTKKPTPVEAFEDNMKDAERLVLYARAFKSDRTRRLRAELRDRIGEALRIPQKERNNLAGIENDEVFVVLKPGSTLTRDDFDDRSFLLRQAVVAACAALETFVADITMQHVGELLGSADPPQRLRDVQLTMGQWIEGNKLKRPQWAMRAVIEEQLRGTSSSAPNQIGIVLSTLGIKNWLKAVDQFRGVKKGTTENQLQTINQRRNNIAHTGDRQGQGRAKIQIKDVVGYLTNIRDTVMGIDEIVKRHGS